MKRLKKIYANIIASFVIGKKNRSMIRKIIVEGDKPHIGKTIKKATATPGRPMKRPWTPPSQTCNRIVSISGEGYSGSSALIDFFREFDVCAVMGNIDRSSAASSMEKKRINIGEFRIFQDKWGILDMQRLLKGNLFNGFHLMNFLTLCESLYASFGGIYNDEFLRLVWEFIDSMTDKRIVNYRRWTYYYKDISKYFVDDKGPFSPTNLFAPYPVFPQETGYVLLLKKM